MTQRKTCIKAINKQILRKNILGSRKTDYNDHINMYEKQNNQFEFVTSPRTRNLPYVN